MDKGHRNQGDSFDYINRSDDYPAMSTLLRVRPEETTAAESPILGASHFELAPRVANVPPWILKSKDAKWTDEPLKSLKYVDDSINIEKFNLRAIPMLEDSGTFLKIAEPARTKGLLEHVTLRAHNRGMKVNNAKASLMCVSAAKSFEPQVKIKLGNDEICGSKTMKILGVHLDSDCSFKTHVRIVTRKLRARSWTLSKLKLAGMCEEQLIKTYCGLV